MGENGWLKSCLKRHGTFTAWHSDIKKVEGEYINGVKEGVWSYWDKNGNLSKKITFKTGKEIKVEDVKNNT